MRKAFLILIVSLITVSAQGQTKLSHSASESLTGSSVSCNAGGIYHSDNYYMRVFKLDDFAIVDSAFLIHMEIGINSSRSLAGTQTVHGTVYTLSGPLMFANLNFVTTKPTSLPDTSNVKIKIPYNGFVLPGDTVVSEFYTPTGSLSDSNYIAVGYNSAGETDDTYLAAPVCGIIEPGGLDTTSGGFPNSCMVMHLWVNQRPTLTGTTFNTTVNTDLDFTEPHFRLMFVDNDGDKPEHVLIVEVPKNGKLYNKTTLVNAGDTIPRLDFDDLTYKPDSTYYGLDSIVIKAKDKHHWNVGTSTMLIRVINPSSVEQTSPVLSISPSPTTGEIRIRCSEEIDAIRITDALGRVLDQFETKPGTGTNTSLMLPNNGPGVYYVSVWSGEWITRPVIKY